MTPQAWLPATHSSRHGRRSGRPHQSCVVGEQGSQREPGYSLASFRRWRCRGWRRWQRDRRTRSRCQSCPFHFVLDESDQAQCGRRVGCVFPEMGGPHPEALQYPQFLFVGTRPGQAVADLRGISGPYGGHYDIEAGVRSPVLVRVEGAADLRGRTWRRRKSVAAPRSGSTPLRLGEVPEQASNMWQETQQRPQLPFWSENALDREAWHKEVNK